MPGDSANTNFGKLRGAWRLPQSADSSAARAQYESLIQAALQEPNAWFALGLSHAEQQRYVEAVDCYRTSLRLRPDHARTWSNLSNALAFLGQFEDGEAAALRALQLNPSSAAAQLNLGSVLSRRGQWEAAENAFQMAISLADDDPTIAAQAQMNVGMLQLFQGQFQTGWGNFEARMRLPSAASMNAPLWKGEPLIGKKLLLFTEQGIGDTVMFARFFRELQARGAEVIVAAPPRLFGLLSSVVVEQSIRLVVKDKCLPDADYAAPLMSVAGRLGVDRVDSIPAPASYLAPDPARTRRWRERLPKTGRNLRIGIAWRGSSANAWDSTRSAALEDYAPLAEMPAVEIYNLQLDGQDQAELAGRKLVTLAGVDREAAFVDTAAIISTLDAVVCVDTALAHVSGALGAPTWIALSTTPDWRWLRQGRCSPWYPSVRLIRQQAQGDWGTVFTRIRNELSLCAAEGGFAVEALDG